MSTLCTACYLPCLTLDVQHPLDVRTCLQREERQLYVVTPAYIGLQTEIAPPKIRGFIVGLAQQLIGIGFIVANWVCPMPLRV